MGQKEEASKAIEELENQRNRLSDELNAKADELKKIQEAE